MLIQAYGSIYSLGHRALIDLFADPVVVQEKVDGSQISFRRNHVTEVEAGAPLLAIRSKGADLHIEAPDKMFKLGIEAISNRYSLLTPGWIYRGEYLAKPKHNALAYDRVPKGNIVLFDVDMGGENYLTFEELRDEAERLDLESVPLLRYGRIENVDSFRDMLGNVSFLGGQKVEGVVVKNYYRFGVDKKILMGKFVSEAFKEIHQAEWKASNPSRQDVVQFLVSKYRTPARWAKAVQHLREAGKLEDTPRDIGLLFKEVPEDIARECKTEILDALWSHFWKDIQRGTTAGLAEWYKEQLLKLQFAKEPA